MSGRWWLGVTNLSKMAAQCVILINPEEKDYQKHANFRDEMRRFFANELQVPFRIVDCNALEEAGKDLIKFD